MAGFRRYAVYFLPEPGEFAALGARWLGWDVSTGAQTPHPDIAGLPGPVEEITETPRRYGFHATIKPPFRLADGYDPAGLETGLAGFCATRAPVWLDGLELTALGRFLALTPRGDTTELNALAAATVAGLDAFRAPLTDAELARRRAGRLSPRQDDMLQRWGYPYVMDDYRFHITLTGKLAKPDLHQAAAALTPVFGAVTPRPLPIRSLCLAGEDDSGVFHLVRRFPLNG